MSTFVAMYQPPTYAWKLCSLSCDDIWLKSIRRGFDFTPISARFDWTNSMISLRTMLPELVIISNSKGFPSFS